MILYLGLKGEEVRVTLEESSPQENAEPAFPPGSQEYYRALLSVNVRVILSKSIG